MFGKTLLNVVSALFIGSQLISMANAAALTGCDTLSLTNIGQITDVDSTACVTSNAELKYCLQGTSYIYGYTSGGSNTATCKLAAGTHVFLDDAILGASDEITAGNKDDLKIYQCTGVTSSTCKTTYGYVYNNEQYLEISASSTNAILELPLTTVASLSGGDCEAGTLYNNEGDSAIELCLGNKVYTQGIAESSIKTYVMNNVEGNVFTNVLDNDPSEDQPMVIQVGDNKIVLATSGYDYCAGENSEVSETFKEFCTHATNNPCEGHPYECANTGLCTRQVDECVIKDGASEDCEAGYYIVGASPNGEGVYSPVETSGDAGVLFHCDGDNCGPATTGFKPGYYKNKAGGDVKYIKCSAQDECEAVGVSVGCDAVGNIISDGGLKICLDINTPSASLFTASGNHFISINDDIKVNNSNDLFTAKKTGDYIVVKINEENVILESLDSGSDKYIYTDATLKIYAKVDRNAVCNADTVLVEFKYDSTNSVSGTESDYIKHAEDQRSSI
eukprot:jgi/Orpsp1_1/1179614/evm.model.c7180000070067.1